jgi:hypothetical protein
MKALIVTFLAVCAFVAASAQDADKIKELEQRIQRLEERMAKVEGPKRMVEVAKQHVESERKNFKAEDIAKAEELYSKASRMLSEGDSKRLLDSVVSTYPQLNRAGCAQLYRGQQETGAEKERLLKDCIERFSTCYYLDGAQVGPMAMFRLAFYYRETGREPEARKLFERIRKESPEAVGHDGELLVKKIE